MDIIQQLELLAEKLGDLVDESYPHFLSAHLRGDEASQASLAKLRQLLEGMASGKI
jgi:hypothetical protein